MRAKTEIVEDKAGAYRILVTEIPYQVNKAQLLEKIAELVQEKNRRHQGLARRVGQRRSPHCRRTQKDAYPKKVLNQLFKLTQLQETFYVNMLALVDGVVPRVLPLKNFLKNT